MLWLCDKVQIQFFTAKQACRIYNKFIAFRETGLPKVPGSK